MPAVKGVGEPCAGEPHARIDAAAGGNWRSVGHAVRTLAPPADPPALVRSMDTCSSRLGDPGGRCGFLPALVADPPHRLAALHGQDVRGVQRYWRAARLAVSDSVPRGSANGRQLGHAGAEALAVARITWLPAELTLRLPVRDTTHPRHQRYANFAADDLGDERGHTARRLCADRLCEPGDSVSDVGGDIARRCCKRPSRRPRPR